MTYSEAYDKIIQAYFKDEIKPWEAKFCFCGTLNNNNSGWQREENLAYSRREFLDMEDALLTPIGGSSEPGMEVYEEEVFAGMSAALEVLKEIHRSRGEDVDAITVPFTKRQLA